MKITRTETIENGRTITRYDASETHVLHTNVIGDIDEARHNEIVEWLSDTLTKKILSEAALKDK